MSNKLANVILVGVISTASVSIFANQLSGFHAPNTSGVKDIRTAQVNLQLNHDTSQIANVTSSVQVGQQGQLGLINYANAGSGIDAHSISITGPNVSSIGNYNSSEVIVSPANTGSIASVSGVKTAQLNTQANMNTSQVANVDSLQVGQIGQVGALNIANAGSGTSAFDINMTGPSVNAIGNYNGSSVTVSPVSTGHLASPEPIN